MHCSDIFSSLFSSFKIIWLDNILIDLPNESLTHISFFSDDGKGMSEA